MLKQYSHLSIGVAILTYMAKPHLTHCLPPFLQSPLKPRVVVVDSSSNDGTQKLAKQMGAEVLIIARKEFNHGSTRELARQFLNTDIVVMVTQDAYPKDTQMLERLISPIIQGKATASYARQIPHIRAGFFESFSREFNYPAESHIRTIRDHLKYGVYTFFFSNSCAAYLNAALKEMGGFKPVLLCEDTIMAAQLLKNGHAIAYVAEALIRHSHRYGLTQEFKRHFDIGIARKEYRYLFAEGGEVTRRGLSYAKALFVKVTKEKIYMLPYAFLHCLAKWLGYQIGYHSQHAPLWIKKILSSQKYYWSPN